MKIKAGQLISGAGGRVLAVLLLLAAFLCLSGCEQPRDNFRESRRHFQIGLEQYREVNLAEAILEFRYAIHLDPNFAEAYYYLGLAYQKTGSLDEALEYFNHYLRFNADHIDTHLQLARIYHSKVKYEEAVKEAKYLLDKLPSEEPARVEMHYILGDVYLNTGEYEPASYHYRQVLEYDPQEPKAYMAFAKIYLAKDDLENAVDMLKRVIDLDPSNKDAKDYLLDLYKKMGKVEKLKEVYLEKLKKLPRKQKKMVADLNSELAQISWREGDYVKAVDYARKTLNNDPTNSRARYYIAKFYLQNEEYEKALGELEVLSKHNYKVEEVMLSIAEIYMRLERTMKAIEIYEELVFVRPDNFPAQYNLTLLCLETQQWERAVRGAKDMISRFYNFGPAYLFLGRAYIFQREFEKGMENLELFLLPDPERMRRTPKYMVQYYEMRYPNLMPDEKYVLDNKREREIEAHYLLGIAYLVQGRTKEAMKKFTRVSKMMPELGDVYLLKAIIYHVRNELEQALFNARLALGQVNVHRELANFVMANLYASQVELSLASDHMEEARGLIYGFKVEQLDITRHVSIGDPAALGHLSLGTVYLLNGWKDNAQVEFALAVQGSPENPLARYLNNELYQLMNKYYYKSTHLAEVLNQIYEK